MTVCTYCINFPDTQCRSTAALQPRGVAPGCDSSGNSDAPTVDPATRTGQGSTAPWMLPYTSASSPIRPQLLLSQCMTLSTHAAKSSANCDNQTDPPNCNITHPCGWHTDGCGGAGMLSGPQISGMPWKIHQSCHVCREVTGVGRSKQGRPPDQVAQASAGLGAVAGHLGGHHPLHLHRMPPLLRHHLIRPPPQ